MPNIFIVLGDTQTRKSAIIRVLTGAFGRALFQIATQNEIIDVFVQIRALQEANINPQEFIRQAADYPNILVSLWISQGNGQPNGLQYIQAFIDTTWPIAQIVVLGIQNLPYNLPQGLPNPLFISDSRNIPANQIAHQIRNHWHWL